MKQPFFSILVPVYNAEKYLDECLATLTSQTFDDYEVVLVDDGSTDSSGKICDACQARFPERIRVIHQQNQGIVLARSQAFRSARGRFFVFSDSDDVLRKDALEILHSYILRYDADMVIYRASSEKDLSIPLQELPFADGEIIGSAPDGELIRMLATSFRMNSLWTKAVRADLVEKDRDYSSLAYISEGEDLMFSLLMIERAKRIVFCDHILYFYRRLSPTSITNTYRPRLFVSIRDVLRMQRSYAQKWDPTGELAKGCDRNALYAFYGVIVRIILSGLPLSEKRKHLLEVVNDEDFLRCMPLLSSIGERKQRYTLALANRKCFFPLYLYGWLRHSGIIPARGQC